MQKKMHCSFNWNMPLWARYKKIKESPLPISLPPSSSSGLSFLDSDDMSTMYHESFIIAQSGSAKGHMAMLDQSHAA